MKRKHKAHAAHNAAYNNIVNINSRKSKRIDIIPKNFNQEIYLKKLNQENNHILFAIGPAGTGKTMIAVQWAINEFKDNLCDKIVITRPAVSVDEQHGFLPGDLNEKMAPWTRPIFDVLRDYFNARDIEGMIEEGIIEIAPLAYMRGRTFKNAFILADEMQNATPNQMKMLLTRLGEGSRMAVTGDLAQADRLKDNGLLDFVKLLEASKAKHLDIVRFEQGDIERHEAVKEILQIYGDE